MSTLYRTRGGRMIHRATCRYAVNGYPWDWAEGREYLDVGVVAEARGYQWCEVCKPCGRPWHIYVGGPT